MCDLCSCCVSYVCSARRKRCKQFCFCLLRPEHTSNCDCLLQFQSARKFVSCEPGWHPLLCCWWTSRSSAAALEFNDGMENGAQGRSFILSPLESSLQQGRQRKRRHSSKKAHGARTGRRSSQCSYCCRARSIPPPHYSPLLSWLFSPNSHLPSP